MRRNAVDYNDVMMPLILFSLAFVTAWAIFLVERFFGSRLLRTFHLNETFGRLFANRSIDKHGNDEAKQPQVAEVSNVSKSHLTAPAVQDIEDNDGGVQVRIKVYSPFTY